MDNRDAQPSGTQDFLRFLAGALIVLVVLYVGLLAFFMTGPSLDDVNTLRTIVFIILLCAMVAWGILLFVGSRIYTVGASDEDTPVSEIGDLGATEVLVAEYVGEGEADETAEPVSDEDTDEGHA